MPNCLTDVKGPGDCGRSVCDFPDQVLSVWHAAAARILQTTDLRADADRWPKARGKSLGSLSKTACDPNKCSRDMSRWLIDVIHHSASTSGSLMSCNSRRCRRTPRKCLLVSLRLSCIMEQNATPHRHGSDPETEIGRLSPLFAKDRPPNREAPQPWHLRDAC